MIDLANLVMTINGEPLPTKMEQQKINMDQHKSTRMNGFNIICDQQTGTNRMSMAAGDLIWMIGC